MEWMLKEDQLQQFLVVRFRQGGLYGYGMLVNGAVATVHGGMIKGGQYDGMIVVGHGAVATVFGGMIKGGLDGDGMAVYGAVATVLGGMIQGGENGDGMYVQTIPPVR